MMNGQKYRIDWLNSMKDLDLFMLENMENIGKEMYRKNNI